MIFLSPVHNKKFAFTKLRNDSIQVTIRQHRLQFAYCTRPVACNDSRIISMNEDVQQVEDKIPTIVYSSEKIKNIIDAEEEQ